MNEKNLMPSEEDQQWLKDLLDSASTEAQPADQSETTAEDQQWLQDLFQSAEQAAEQEFAPAQPAETPLVEQIDQWPEELPQAPQPAQEIGPDEQAVAGLVRPEDAELEKIIQEIEAMIPQEEPDEQAAPAPQLALAPHTDVVDLEDEAEEQEDDEDDEPFEEDTPSKRRPKKKDTYGLFGIPHLLVTVVWVTIILSFGVFLGQWLWQGASDVLAFGREEKLVTITVTASDDLDSLTEKLRTAGLVNEPMWFRLYGQLTDAMEDIDPGTYELNTLFDYHALVGHMSANSAARVTVKVVIPEGYSCAQIFALLEEKGICTAAQLEAAAIGNQLEDYWFLKGVARDHKYCLEGYLFPDTYEFYVGDKPERVLNKLLSNFDNRFTDIMQSKLDVLNETLAEMMRDNGMAESYIENHQFTIREVVIIASLIEKETAGAAEGYTISSVIYNRLTNPVHFPYLNIDAALLYATGNSAVTEDDKLLDSPYNTYLYPGLIPGPICNPSRVSIDAALDPSETKYYYYALNPETSQHHFSETLKEHQAFLESLAKEEPETP